MIRLPGKWRILFWRLSFTGAFGTAAVQRQWPSEAGFAEPPFIVASAKCVGDPGSYMMYSGGNASYYECYVHTNSANDCNATVIAAGKTA